MFSFQIMLIYDSVPSFVEQFFNNFEDLRYCFYMLFASAISRVLCPKTNQTGVGVEGII